MGNMVDRIGNCSSGASPVMISTWRIGCSVAPGSCVKKRCVRRVYACLLLVGTLLLGSASPIFGQRDRHDSYYQGMNRQVRQGDYERYSRDDERRHPHPDQGGGIGPGKGAIIGGVGGAVLGAVFGGGLKGTIIGGAAGAGIGALGAKLAEDEDRNKRERR